MNSSFKPHLETHSHALQRFLLLVAVLLVYAILMINKYGASQGITVTFLTWAFFLFCTPVADAGFLLAFPLRLFLGIRMLHTQILAYLLASVFVFFAVYFYPAIFQKTILLKLFYTILTTPVPYWLIILLSFIGTLASIIFGDELLDVATHSERVIYHKHHNRYYLLLMIFLFTFAALFYKFLLDRMGVSIPLF